MHVEGRTDLVVLQLKKHVIILDSEEGCRALRLHLADVHLRSTSFLVSNHDDLDGQAEGSLLVEGNVHLLCGYGTLEDDVERSLLLDDLPSILTAETTLAGRPQDVLVQLGDVPALCDPFLRRGGVRRHLP